MTTSKNQKPIAILTYHSISTPPKGTALRSAAVSVKNLHWQFRLLKWLGYKALSMSDLQPYLSGQKKGKVVGLTFDDGYLDNWQQALPLLNKFGFSATCYMVSGQVGKNNHWAIPKNIVERPLMNLTQMREWQAAGNDIGCHTTSHAHLPQCGATELEQEILVSKQYLEQELDTTVAHFAYPYGEYDDKTVAAVAAAGFTTAVTTQRSRVLAGDKLLLLPRVNIARTTLPHLFLMKIISRYEDKRRKK
jgi:peptidoglycan/xylan/chitin deacetylase (PgdA/CDA1 family)